jgi:hypothetical protein
MSTVAVKAKRDFLSSLANVRPVLALSELIWNGFDAGGSKVRVSIDMNALETMETIRVSDDGDGIPHEEVEWLFGNLGASWKRSKEKANGRILHGKSGKGRFRAFGLGSMVVWNTVFQDNGRSYQYKIEGSRDSLDAFSVSDPVEVQNRPAGTEVSIFNLDHHFTSLTNNDAPIELAKQFAFYLTKYPSVSLEYQGVVIDPKKVQDDRNDYDLPIIELANGKTIASSVTIIEWKFSTERKMYLCDQAGTILHEAHSPPRLRAPGFQFTTYVKSDYFSQLDAENRLMLDDLSPEVDSILRTARDAAKRHFRLKLLKDKGEIVSRWKSEDIYPFAGAPQNQVEETERQVFDILAVNVESYLPSFEDADVASRRFTFRLLSQAIKDNPESVQKIITEVLHLKKEDQDDLAELLKITTLSAIIRSSQEVANRLNCLLGLEQLLFDKDTKKSLLERDQLHKILEKEAWLFHEEFALSGSEERLEEVLAKHIGELGDRADPVTLPDGKQGRIDLMLSKANQPRTGEYDYLVVELKRPRKKIDDQVLNQIKKYAIAVAKDERFHGIPAKWTFLAISNELDDFAIHEANQRNRKPGCVYDDDTHNITVWVRTWAEVINDARARLLFINEYLSYESTRESARKHLQKVHSKFIPQNVDDVPDDAEEES